MKNNSVESVQTSKKYEIAKIERLQGKFDRLYKTKYAFLACASLSAYILATGFYDKLGVLGNSDAMRLVSNVFLGLSGLGFEYCSLEQIEINRILEHLNSLVGEKPMVNLDGETRGR